MSEVCPYCGTPRSDWHDEVCLAWRNRYTTPIFTLVMLGLLGLIVGLRLGGAL